MRFSTTIPVHLIILLALSFSQRHRSLLLSDSIHHLVVNRKLIIQFDYLLFHIFLLFDGQSKIN